jgi:hypothetical protein
MSRFDSRSTARLLFVAVTVACAPAAAGPPRPTTGGTRPTGPKASDTPPPASKGWPHKVLTGSGVHCARDPQPTEVIVFADGNFSGKCAVLVAGFYPYATNFLVGNDAMSAIKIGSAVRARVFKNAGYGGGWTIYGPGTASGGLGPWDDVISSIRVEPASRHETCDDVQEGEIGLYENGWFAGDCVVLPADDSYASADIMGIANDSISSMKNNSPRRLVPYWNASFDVAGPSVEPHTSVDNLPGHHGLTTGMNDHISSIQMVTP